MPRVYLSQTIGPPSDDSRNGGNGGIPKNVKKNEVTRARQEPAVRSGAETLREQRFTSSSSAPIVREPEGNVTVGIRAASAPLVGSTARVCMSLGSDLSAAEDRRIVKQ